MSAVEDELVYPLRECAPWCEVGDGHPAEHPVDRCCYSEFNIVALSRHEPMRVVERRGERARWRMAFLNVYLRRRPEDAEPLVYVHSEETDKELRLTRSEAIELRQALDSLIDTIETAGE